MLLLSCCLMFRLHFSLFSPIILFSTLSSSIYSFILLLFLLLKIIHENLALFQLNFGRWCLNFGGFLASKLLFLLVLSPAVFINFVFKNMNLYNTYINDIIVILIFILYQIKLIKDCFILDSSFFFQPI